MFSVWAELQNVISAATSWLCVVIGSSADEMYCTASARVGKQG